MRLRVFLSCVLAALLSWSAASADYLRVSRPATVKSRPAADAAGDPPHHGDGGRAGAVASLGRVLE